MDKQYNMTTGNEVNDVNSPLQTQESEMGDAELQVDANRVDTGEKSDESRTNVAPPLVAKNVEKLLRLDKRFYLDYFT